MAITMAKVKSITSGDTLVLASLRAATPGKPPPERTLSLAYISAPRLSRNGDEPYAFASREFLRKNLVGKDVGFTVLYTVPTTKREFGYVTLAGANVLEKVVGEGWAKLREDAGRKEESPEGEALIEKLKVLEGKARSEGKGVWSTTDDGRVEDQYENPADPKAFVEKYKGKPIDSIIERVVSGDRVAVRLLLQPKVHQQALVVLAGIRAPLSKRSGGEGLGEQAGEEHGEEAKLFVESRLLQRSVTISLLGLTPQSQFVGTVMHTVGNIAEFEVAEGLARCFDQHSSLLGSDMSKLRAAEKTAKEKKLRLWKEHVSKSKDTNNSFDATVSKIVSADTIFVRNKAGSERKINFSSIRQPKPSDEKQKIFQAEAKEFLRKRLIGKHVHITIDGKRPAQGDFEERETATVTQNNKNVALMLVESGYASVIRHRATDEDRSPVWDDLLAAEQGAEASKVGMHNPKPAQSQGPPVDASETLPKAKGYLGTLKRQKRIPAVVDFVSAGSRFKLLIPRENAKITFVLGGIRAPRTARNDSDKSEPMGPEALEFASRKCLQRDVEIDVDDVDRVGGFIGTLFINRENLAKLLVEEGLASVHAYSAEKSAHATELHAAEEAAKAARKGLWVDYEPSADNVDPVQEEDEPALNGDGVESDTPPRKDYKDVIITNIDENGKLMVQTIGDDTKKLETLMKNFKSFHLQSSNNTSLSGPPRVGDVVAAKFTEDNSYYRARVRRVDRESQKAEVLYIDYGNSESLPFSSLRPLTQSQFTTSTLSAQARPAQLSFVQLPAQKDYLQDAIGLMTEFHAGAQMVVNVDFTDKKDGTVYLTVFDPAKSANEDDSLNAELVKEGLGIVPRKMQPWEKRAQARVKKSREWEEAAKEGKRGMFEYGDMTED